MTVGEIQALATKIGKDKIISMWFDSSNKFTLDKTMTFDEQVKFDTTSNVIVCRRKASTLYVQGSTTGTQEYDFYTFVPDGFRAFVHTQTAAYTF